ncbi:two-component sensor histidine kinase [Thioclava sp. ES.031]|uniref:sensor histidine kinase n=1 Tax=Thioclava sp. ES.031 TaxID=1798203 RepID=UPI000BF5B736|nr:sensor histidine kinase [Thioclava sp. ES.031]PFG65149.1 two-component sensor histidine kinase [Thioclava sp. ES.031]
MNSEAAEAADDEHYSDHAPFRARKRGVIPFFDGLGVRLAFMLAVALFPLLIIAVLQSTSVVREAQARSEAALMGETMRAVAGETRVIQHAQDAARVLASTVQPLVGNAEACSDWMRQISGAFPEFSLVSFIPDSGKMTCSNSGKSYNFKGQDIFEKMMTADRTSFYVNREAPVSGTSVLGVAHPVYNAAGDHIGIIAISMSHSSLSLAKDGPKLADDRPLVIMTFDREGTILTSSDGLANTQSHLPVDRSLKLLAGNGAVTFSGDSNRGIERVYSVVELVPDQLYALGSWPAQAASALSPFADISPVLFPALMWMASLLVAYFAMQKLVIGHVRKLSSAITSFATGSRIVGNLNLSTAPSEIRDLAEAYDRMTETILHDEAELEDMVHHKEVLLREVHHRVKNNLQLIASIINMQMRQARTPEAKGLMKSLQERVISLATIHRGLYQTSGLTDIRAQELLPDIVRQITRLATGPGRHIAVDCQIDDIHLTPDQAVPLSLLLTEAMTNAMKYASARDDKPKLDISLRKLEGMQARLCVRNTVDKDAPPLEAVDGTGLGSQLVNAFVQQLSGTIEIETSDEEYMLNADFTLRPLVESELRHEERLKSQKPETVSEESH